MVSLTKSSKIARMHVPLLSSLTRYTGPILGESQRRTACVDALKGLDRLMAAGIARAIVAKIVDDALSRTGLCLVPICRPFNIFRLGY